MSGIVEESVVQELMNRLIFESLTDIHITKQQVTEEHKEVLLSLFTEHPRLSHLSVEDRYQVVSNAIAHYLAD